MCSLILRAHLTRVITYGFVVFCGVPASEAAQVSGGGDLGMLGQSYSFSMDLDPADNPVRRAFTASHAVQFVTLTHTSGGSYVVGEPSNDHGLVIGIDTSERGVGFVYRAHGAVEQATMFSTAGRANTDTGTPAGAYSYTRDADNHLWWAAPLHPRVD